MKKVDPQVLLDNEVISKETFDKIVEYQNSKKEEKNPAKKISIMMNVIASVFAAMGLIWIVAANWQVIPGWLKIIFCLIITVVALGYLVIGKNQKKNLEAASIFYIGTIAVTIAIIGQVFNVSANLGLYFLTLIIFTGLLPFYTKSKICEALYLVFTGMYIAAMPNICEVFTFTDGTFLTRHDWIGVLISMIAMLIIPFVTLKKEKIKLLSNENLQQKSFKSIYVSLFTLLIGLFTIEYSIISAESLVAPFVFVYVLLVITQMFNRTIQSALYRVTVYVLLFLGSLEGFSFMFEEDFNFMSFIGLLFAIVLFAYYIVNKIKCKNEYKKALNQDINVTDSSEKQLEKSNEIKKLRKKFSIARIDALVICSSLFWPLCNIIVELTSRGRVGTIMEWFFLVYLILLAVILMKTGIKEKISKYLYTGEIIFAVEMLRLLFEVTDNLMIKGILSIIVAILIVLANKNTMKKNLE